MYTGLIDLKDGSLLDAFSFYFCSEIKEQIIYLRFKSDLRSRERESEF